MYKVLIGFYTFTFWHHNNYWGHFIGNITFCSFTGLGNLKVLNLGFNDIGDACLAHLKGDFKF